MSTLRDAINSAAASLREQISAEAVRRLKGTSGEVLGELQESYNDFFQILHEYILNDPTLNAADDATPRLFANSGIGTPNWQAVEPQWFKQKERAARSGDSRSLNYYHGLTNSMVGAGFGRRTRKGRFKKRRSTLSFDQYIQSLAMSQGEAVQGFFGPMKVAYALTRPDGGKVSVKQLDDVIKEIRQFKPKGRGQVLPIDGTVIHTTVTAFPKVDRIIDERSVIAHMMRTGGYREQWVKVVGSTRSNYRIRAIILPLINWYVKRKFIDLLEERFG